MNDGEIVRARLLVSGRVQGVFYRYLTAEEAKARSLTGWVRNVADGRVEVVFEGPREGVESMIAWCHQGPPMAEVERVDVAWEDVRNEATFRIRD